MVRYAQMAVVCLALVLLFAQLVVRGGEVGFVGGLVAYLVLWWTVLFCVLPLRVQGQFETGEIVPGSEPGAPADPMLKQKAWLTTVAASALWLVYFTIMQAGIINLDALPLGDRLGPQW